MENDNEQVNDSMVKLLKSFDELKKSFDGTKNTIDEILNDLEKEKEQAKINKIIRRARYKNVEKVKICRFSFISYRLLFFLLVLKMVHFLCIVLSIYFV